MDDFKLAALITISYLKPYNQAVVVSPYQEDMLNVRDRTLDLIERNFCDAMIKLADETIFFENGSYIHFTYLYREANISRGTRVFHSLDMYEMEQAMLNKGIVDDVLKPFFG
jgi:hypothetical protein